MGTNKGWVLFFDIEVQEPIGHYRVSSKGREVTRMYTYHLWISLPLAHCFKLIMTIFVHFVQDIYTCIRRYMYM